MLLVPRFFISGETPSQGRDRGHRRLSAKSTRTGRQMRRTRRNVVGGVRERELVWRLQESERGVRILDPKKGAPEPRTDYE